MKLIVCIDKNGGMMFGGRRLSKDSILIEKIKELSKHSKLLMNNYTANLFESDKNIIVSDDFIEKSGADDFCFAENREVSIEKIDELYLFNWNRDYPADFYLWFNPKAAGYKKERTGNFVGSSHKKITLEIYKRG